MREGGEAALCVLASCEAPEREGDGLTSMGAGVVLSSTAVRLGEHGTVHELAEGELFRWAYASEFDALRFTHPIALSAERCMVHLRLTNARVGMEQLVFYTALGGGPLPERRKRRRRSTRPRPRWQRGEGKSCASTHKIQFAVQIDKNRGHAPRFLYF